MRPVWQFKLIVMNIGGGGGCDLGVKEIYNNYFFGK